MSVGCPRRAGLLALAGLVVLRAVAALSQPTEAATPDDLGLILSLANDADNVVPPDTTITVTAHLRHTGARANLEITSGTWNGAITGAHATLSAQGGKLAASATPNG